MPTLDRQRALARQKLERQMARRAAAAKRRRQLQAGTAAALAVVVIIGGVTLLVLKLRSDDKPASNTAAPKPSAAASLPPGSCAYPKSSGGQVKNVGTPVTKNVAHTGTRTATIKTSVGDLTFELDQAKAPCTANSFEFLAAKKYYDGTSCHRVTTSGIFVLQCGDPTATGGGGPGYQYGEENLPADPKKGYVKGVLAMANAGAGTNGSQFFIVYKDGSALDSKYSIFGKVTKGIDKVEEVAAAGVEGGGQDGKPKKAVKFDTVKLGPLT
ncbi:MAG: peptidyl-prolyl cis-trans isomerase [Actinomycetia bacterium]|nr:peptidyl-prolyl cis-trans isomerase [Actinomycetes bacterium]MDQ1654286.1 peptidyl-prolyl cis-trans isomerase [Cryptosporangiaceae bacterium]MDQ1657594.1 peptidyl-prolyl cis-trans isomerase [Cryptosporangiaceae bacterium]